MRHLRPLSRGSMLVVLALVVFGTTGCTIGYRYHQLDSNIANAHGANAQVVGSGHTVELGIVLDFRYFRFVTPYLGSDYEMDVQDSHGGGAHQSFLEEERGMRLDVPVVSVFNEEGVGLGYPGTMVHRKSLELWLSATGKPASVPMWFTDLGLVYYHHNWAAVRVFGGWGAVPFEGSTSRIGESSRQHEFWATTAQGPTAGIELTLGAGEQALDFLKFFVDSQKEAGKPIR